MSESGRSWLAVLEGGFADGEGYNSCVHAPWGHRLADPRITIVFLVRSHVNVAAAAPHNPGFQTVIFLGFARGCALSMRISATCAYG